MNGKFKTYYYTTNFICLCTIIVCMYLIQLTVNDYYTVKNNSDKFKNCNVFLFWKFDILLTIAVFCLGFSFLNYLLFRRRKNYYFNIYFKFGPVIDRTIMLFLYVFSLLYGPGLIFQIIMMFMYYSDINDNCAYNINDQVKYLYLPFCLFGFVFGILMTTLFFLLCWKRCSRKSIVNERDITDINELIYFI